MTYRLNSDPIKNTKIIIAAGQSQVFIGQLLNSRNSMITIPSMKTLKWVEYREKVFYSNAIIKELSKLWNH